MVGEGDRKRGEPPASIPRMGGVGDGLARRRRINSADDTAGPACGAPPPPGRGGRLLAWPLLLDGKGPETHALDRSMLPPPPKGLWLRGPTGAPPTCGAAPPSMPMGNTAKEGEYRPLSTTWPAAPSEPGPSAPTARRRACPARPHPKGHSTCHRTSLIMHPHPPRMPLSIHPI